MIKFDTIEIFIENATRLEAAAFIKFCSETKVFPSNAALSNYYALLDKNDKLRDIANEILNSLEFKTNTELTVFIVLVQELIEKLNEEECSKCSHSADVVDIENWIRDNR